jgi:hypothetical protein
MEKYARITKEVDVRIFPDDGPTQFAVAKWIENNGGVCHLYDGCAEQNVVTSTDANWRWKSISIEGQYKIARVGDYIVKDVDGVFRVFSQDEFSNNFYCL